MYADPSKRICEVYATDYTPTPAFYPSQNLQKDAHLRKLGRMLIKVICYSAHYDIASTLTAGEIYEFSNIHFVADLSDPGKVKAKSGDIHENAIQRSHNEDAIVALEE